MTASLTPTLTLLPIVQENEKFLWHEFKSFSYKEQGKYSEKYPEIEVYVQESFTISMPPIAPNLKFMAEFDFIPLTLNLHYVDRYFLVVKIWGP